MSDLNHIEKHKLEKLFGMRSGYVLNFSDRSFAEFIAESVQKDIWGEDKYKYSTGSKANRLRAFWKVEPNYLVGNLLTDLLEYCRDNSVVDQGLWLECQSIAKRLLQNTPIQDIETIPKVAGGRDFERLVKTIRDSIEKGEPEMGLDRLHTFIVMYLRDICGKHGIDANKDKPLQSLVGEYVKHLRQQGLIESEMTERILKSSISIMQAFNDVRNKQSLAHDNQILNRNESMLIVSHVVSSARFIGALENERDRRENEGLTSDSNDDDLPF